MKRSVGAGGPGRFGRGTRRRGSVRQPGVRIGGQLLHRLGELPRDDVGNGHLLEYRAQAGPHRHPDVLEVLGRPLVAGHLRAQSAHLGQRSVEGPDDVGHRDVGGRARQTVATVGTTLAQQEAGTPHVVEDALEELGRERLRLRQRLGRHRAPVGVGQGAEGPHGIVDLGGDVHGGILPEDVAPCGPTGRWGCRAPVAAYSAAMAASTSSLAALRAGQDAAPSPSSAARTRKTTRLVKGTTMSVMPCCFNDAAKATPSPVPMATPMRAPNTDRMTASDRIIDRTWRRLMPTARSRPISWVRSKTDSMRVLTIPMSATRTASARST